MSHVATGWAYKQDIDNGGAKFVLVALADFADETGSCFPSQATLARMTGQASSSVRRHVQWLEAAGFLRRARRANGQGHRTSDRYRLVLDQPLPLTSPTRQGERSEHESLPPKTPSRQDAHKAIPTAQTERSEHGDPEIPTAQSLPLRLSEELPKEEPPRTNPQKPRKRATTIPEGWWPTDEMARWARDLTGPGVDLKDLTEHFLDHHASKGSTFADWNRAWQTWVRNSRKFGNAGARSKAESPEERMLRESREKRAAS